jgi:hypothetical protein
MKHSKAEPRLEEIPEPECLELLARHTSIYLLQLEGQEDPWWPKLAAELGLEGEGGTSTAEVRP